MSGHWEHAPLPAESFVSMAEFVDANERLAAVLRARRRAEARALAGPASRDGTCAPCLRATRWQSAPAAAAPWRAQRCDCEEQLDAADRALLHAALTLGGLRAWTRLLLLGPDRPLHRRLAGTAQHATSAADLADPRLGVAPASADLIVAADCLHRAAHLPPLLAALREAAAPGATMLASLPFQADTLVTRRLRPGHAGPLLRPAPMHAIGWNLLDLLIEAGWERAEMLRVWDRELGYLGPNNFLLRAVAGPWRAP